MQPHRVQHVERSQRIDREIGTWIDDGRRHGDLCGQMQHRVKTVFLEHPVDTVAIPDVDVGEVEGGAVAQPFQVLVRSCPGQVVQDGHVPIAGPEIARGIASDEAGASSNQHSLGSHGRFR